MTSLRDILDRYRLHPDFLGTDLISANQRGAVDDAPLHIAARKGAVEDIVVLIENGAKVNLQGDLGNTPLHYAALTGMLEAATKLMELGADPNVENEFGENPAMVAEQGGHEHIGRLIRRSLRQR